MKTRTHGLAAAAAALALAAPAGAAPRLEIGPLVRRLAVPGLRASYVARLPGSSTIGLRFLTTGSTIYWMDAAGRLWPLMHRATLFGVVTDPERGAILCTSRGVYATRDGRYLRRLSSMIFTKVVAAPVGGLFACPDEGIYGFDGEQFHLIRSIPWHSIEALAVEPGGAVWFVGSYTQPDGTAAPPRLYVSRERDGQLVIEDPLPEALTVSSVAEYFGGIVATVDGELRGTADSGESWVTFDYFGRTDLTVTSVPLYEAPAWQALWIGVMEEDVGPAPLWYDDYWNGLVPQPINARRVLQVTADLSREVMLFVADEALYEAPYRVLDEGPAP